MLAAAGSGAGGWWWIGTGFEEDQWVWADAAKIGAVTEAAKGGIVGSTDEETIEEARTELSTKVMRTAEDTRSKTAGAIAACVRDETPAKNTNTVEYGWLGATVARQATVEVTRSLAETIGEAKRIGPTEAENEKDWGDPNRRFPSR